MTTNDKASKQHAIAQFNRLKNRGIAEGFRVTVIDGVGYDRAREISNSRPEFDYQPWAVAYPRNAEQVATCLKFCQTHKDIEGQTFGLRIRSGGHQHEAMCSADNVLIVRLSEMNTIVYPDPVKRDTAWLPVGKKLQEAYYEVGLHGKVIPGGGCQSVNPGGLIHGGGWGWATRMYGLTCDSVIEVEVVLANGNIVRANANNAYQDLFWAVRGGGGGNFGIVTRFLIKLSPLKKDGHLTWFAELGRKDLTKVEVEQFVAAYLEIQAKFPHELTTAAAVRVKNPDRSNGLHPVTIAGRYYGPKSDLKTLLEPLKPYLKGDLWAQSKPASLGASSGRLLGFSASLAETDHPDYREEYIHELDAALGDFLYPSAPVMSLAPSGAQDAEGDKEKRITKPPASTCDAPHPHKISSAFPLADSDAADKQANYAKIARATANFFDQTNRSKEAWKPYQSASLYLVLHGLGATQKANSAVKNFAPAETAFFWRNKDVIFQWQAWWSDPANPKEGEFLKWIAAGRAALSGPNLVEGACINFVDKNLDLAAYYGKSKGGSNLPRLKQIKAKYDPNKVFWFDEKLSIPPE